MYGFITIPSELIYDLISHPFFQRLRYIKQLGMTHLVYPGALHTRFHHALGAMHLMSLALEVLKNKGHEINPEEEQAALIAILLHDIGHGPFSHALEHSLVNGVHHESISMLMMEKLNLEFDGKLSLAIQIFKNQYPKKYLHQLISGQVDLDRMDYLNRDSFFTGVSEGVISFDRLIKMFNLVDDNLVIEEKGIYSTENFLIARRLMYWQVYLHKTVIAGEQLLVKILERAKTLSLNGVELFAAPALQHFLKNNISESDFLKEEKHLLNFAKLDDQDVYAAIKVWADESDRVLSKLCGMLIHRQLYKVEVSDVAPDAAKIASIQKRLQTKLNLSEEDLKYFAFTISITNRAYNAGASKINILKKDNTLIDVVKASDLSTLQTLDKTVEKHVFCYLDC